jgi:hypothetical protein
VYQSVVTGPATITVGASGMISATYTGIATFSASGQIATLQLFLDGVGVPTSEADTGAASFPGESTEQVLTRTWLFTGLVAGTSHTVDAQMIGIGAEANNNVLTIYTF